MPGPAHYQAASSIKKNNRHCESHQSSTWAKIRVGLDERPKETPGPGAYEFEPDNERIKYSNLEPGYKFPQGETDPLQNRKSKNLAAMPVPPGPDKYHLPPSIRPIQAPHKTMGEPAPVVDRAQSDMDPGPGMYYPNHQWTIPSFKIAQDTELNEKQQQMHKIDQTKMHVGPQSYSPHEPQAPEKGAKIGSGLRIDN